MIISHRHKMPPYEWVHTTQWMVKWHAFLRNMAWWCRDACRSVSLEQCVQVFFWYHAFLHGTSNFSPCLFLVFLLDVPCYRIFSTGNTWIITLIQWFNKRNFFVWFPRCWKIERQTAQQHLSMSDSQCQVMCLWLTPSNAPGEVRTRQDGEPAGPPLSPPPSLPLSPQINK